VGLRFDPVGGGQFKEAVRQIIEAESQPIKVLEARKAKEDARLKLFQEFKTKFGGLDKAISEIATFSKFRELKVDLGDGGNLVSVTLDKDKAEPGVYNIEIDDLAARTSVISNGFDSATDTTLGNGFITMNLQNGESAEIYVDDKNSNLRGIANAINHNANAPVRASVVRDESDTDAPYKLLLSAKKDGAANQLDFPEFYFMDGGSEFYIEDDREAQNASITIDGFPIELPSNDVVDFLQGVNMHLKQARPDQPFTMTITEDYQKIAGKMKGLVDQVNQVLQFIIKQNTVDEKSDTSTTFAGDSSLQSMEYRLRNAIQAGFPVTDPDTGGMKVMYLTQMGVEFEKTGQMLFKEDKFNKAVESNFDMVAEAISGPTGFAATIKTLTDSYTRTGNGLLNVKEQGLKSRIKAVDDQIDQKKILLEKKKQSVVDQFSRLEATLGNLQRQQQYVSATLGGGGGGNPLSQLLGG
jgi:flagellar hook-associated protein 2